jgi:lipopolysaccharide heptosyltransferase II
MRASTAQWVVEPMSMLARSTEERDSDLLHLRDIDRAGLLARFRKIFQSAAFRAKARGRPIVNVWRKKLRSVKNQMMSDSWRIWNQGRKRVLSAAFRIKSQSWRWFNQGRKYGFVLLRRAIGDHRVDRLKRWTFQTIMSAALYRQPNRSNPEIPENARQILVFGDMGLGNFLMFTPALETLRTRYPEAEIVVVFFKARGAEVIAQGNPNIDRIVTIDMPKRAGLGAFRHLVRSARAAGISPDMVIARWNGSPYVAMLTMWLRPTTRVGHVTSAGFKGYFDDVFNFPVSMTEEAHEVERNLDLARALGAEPTTYTMHLPISEKQGKEADKLIAERGFDPARLICLQTGSSKLQSWKRWPEQSWAALAEQLAGAGYDLAFVGSDEESDIASAIIAATPSVAGEENRNICGALSVNATGALIARSRGIICNDSGLMHVAAAVGTPIIGLFGPTEYDRTRPFVDNCVILRYPCSCNHGTLFDRKTLAKIEACDRPCLVSTTPDQVVAVALKSMPIAARQPRRATRSV